MSLVTFVPKQGTEYDNGWPERVVGDGFIDLQLQDYDLRSDSAIYRDQFRDEYEFIGSAEGKWTVEVREDG